jgi:hypothetical protein
MMSLTRLKPLVAVGAALILAIAGVAVQGRQQPAPQGAQEQVKATPQAILPPIGSGAAALPDLAANRALARQQLAVIDEAWAILENLSRSARIDIDGGTIGPWGRRRLEALRRAGAGKAEIVAALEKYINDLERFDAIYHNEHNHHHPTYAEHEIKFLRMEAEIWLNEEKAR